MNNERQKQRRLEQQLKIDEDQQRQDQQGRNDQAQSREAQRQGRTEGVGPGGPPPPPLLGKKTPVGGTGRCFCRANFSIFL